MTHETTIFTAARDTRGWPFLASCSCGWNRGAETVDLAADACTNHLRDEGLGVTDAIVYPPKGCICPPGCESYCQLTDCGRRPPGAAVPAPYVAPLKAAVFGYDTGRYRGTPP